MIDEVILLDDMLEEFTHNSEDIGHWENGEWVQDSTQATDFEGVILPLEQKDIQYLPEGLTNTNTQIVYTKENLDDVINVKFTRVLDGKIYRLYQYEGFKNLADLNVYLLARLEGES